MVPSPPPGRRRRTLATQVLRPRPAQRQGIQRIPSPQPGEGRFGQPPRRLVPPCGIKLQRIRRPERRGTKGTLRFDRRPRENPLRSARTNLIAPSRGRKDADHKSGGPLLHRKYIVHAKCASMRCDKPGFAHVSRSLALRPECN